MKIGAIATAAAFGIVAALVVAGLFDGSASAVRLPAVADEMRAFDEPPIAASETPDVVRRAEESLRRAGHGEIIPGQTRRLATGLGKNGVGIYAMPATGGAVCVVVSEATYAATCVDSFDRRAANVRWIIYSGIGAPLSVAGLANDAVTDVKVVVDGVARDAVLERNAFFWQAEIGTPRSAMTALLVRQADGEMLKVRLDF
jgi:hypothetical protein